MLRAGMRHLLVLLIAANVCAGTIIGVPKGLVCDHEVGCWWAGTNVTVVDLISTQQGFAMLQTHTIDIFVAFDTDTFCLPAHDFIPTELLIATSDRVRVEAVEQPDQTSITILLPTKAEQDPMLLLAARLNLQLVYGLDLAHHQLTFSENTSMANATFEMELGHAPAQALSLTKGVWYARPSLSQEDQATAIATILAHDEKLDKPAGWSKHTNKLHHDMRLVQTHLGLAPAQLCHSSAAYPALMCHSQVSTSGACAECPSNADKCICSKCVDPQLPQVYAIAYQSVSKDEVQTVRPVKPCYHQQACLETVDKFQPVFAVHHPHDIDQLIVTSFHQNDTVEVVQLDTTSSLVMLRTGSTGLHVLRFDVLGKQLDVGVQISAYQCRPLLDPGCPCPSGTFEHKDQCVKSSKMVELTVVPGVILLVIVWLMLAESRVEASKGWALKPSELQFTNPPQILGAGSFGVVVKGWFRGTIVAVKQAIPDTTRRYTWASMLSGWKSSKRSKSLKRLDFKKGKSGSSEKLEQEKSERPAAKQRRATQQASSKDIQRLMKELAPKEENTAAKPRRISSMLGGRPQAPAATFMMSIVEEEQEPDEMDVPEDTPNTLGLAMTGMPLPHASMGLQSMQMASMGRRQSKRSRRLQSSNLKQSTKLRLLKQDMMQELAVLTKMRHPNITTVLGCCVEKGVTPLLVLELLELGSLYDVIHKNNSVNLDLELGIPILKDVAAGLAYLHGSSPALVHADLKSGNILVDAHFKAKLTDFGLSTRRQLGAVGTPFWMAPELLYNETPTTASDIYAFGIVIFEVATLALPYGKEPVVEVLREVMGKHDPPKRPRIPASTVVPSYIAELMEACWDDSPMRRPVAAAVLAKICEFISEDNVIMKAKRQNQMQQQVLNDVFPKHIADALAEGREIEPEKKACVTIFFSDIVGFTNISSQLTPMKVSRMLDRLYQAFDELSYQHDIYTVETIGDAFMGATNLVKDQDDHAVRMGRFAVAAIEAAGKTMIDTDQPELGCISIRVGLHSGPVVANVVGRRNPRYCLFGDTVNTASRMESNSEKGKIQLSASAASLVQEQGCNGLKLQKRGEITIKGKGSMTTYWLTKRARKSRKASRTSRTSMQSRKSFLAYEEDSVVINLSTAEL
eukprot:TRINITY_DN12418_c0_g2_i16.p1 TRINITY_DN12418_c0_g2~~TRINITY_DN12418_c0_g2_i16.p1  ORF type:complete len:1139 (+),score=197.38 TRINITY_DN12418_c0_g2_i16:1869-5285(+)